MELWKQTSLTSIQWVQGTPRWRTYFLVHGYIKERWKWMGELLLFFLFIVFFPMDLGNATDVRIFSCWHSVSLFGSRWRYAKKRIGASGIAGVPEVPMHVNVEAALTEFLTCQPWRCEHHFAQSWTAHFHGVNPSVQDNLTLRSRNLRQIGQRWPKCDWKQEDCKAWQVDQESATVWNLGSLKNSSPSVFQWS